MPEGMQLLHNRVLSLGLFQDWDFGSAPFHNFRKSPCADLARVRSPDVEYARANCRNASPPIDR
jgi:hypothetical protein